MSGRPFEPLSFEGTYDKALSYLYNLQKFGIKFGLSKTENLLRAFGDPHRKLACIHIAGSNGKGSVAAMLASIYTQAGYKVGLFTSPHLLDFRERFRINGRMISRSRTLELIREIQKKTDKREPPTFFEFVTAMALIWFERGKVDLAVMETGLGGRLDATNVIFPLISIITNISLEHQDYLGKSLKKIAEEKAGIIKRGVPLVTGVTQPAIQRQLEALCSQRRAPLWLAGRDFRTRKTGPGLFTYYALEIPGVGKKKTTDLWEDPGSKFKVSKAGRMAPPVLNYLPKFQRLSVALDGDHQFKNAGLALTAVSLLCKKFPVKEEDIRRGLAQVAWPGRMETLSEHPRIVLDGAHNPGAMKVLAQALPRTFSYRRLLLVFGMMKDKNIRRTLSVIAPLADRIFFTRAEYDRSAEPAEIQRLWARRTPPSEICPNIPQAIERALSAAQVEDLILITGSLFIVGETLAVWKRRTSAFSL